MSTSISPQFEAAVALLWGDRWWISGRSEPLVFGAMARAADALCAHFAEAGRPARLRVLYQPGFLVSVAVACPDGSRAALRAALRDEHPSLADAACAWGYEPIIGGHTQLHYETEPGLFAMVNALEDGGLVVEGTWPLTTVVNPMPEDLPKTGAFTVIVVAAHRSLVFRHTPAGTREVQSAAGDKSAVLVATTVQQASERNDAALYMVALDAAGQRLSAQLAKLQRPGRTDLGWSDVVRAALTLSLTQPNQLLPVRSRLGARRVLFGLTALALILSGMVAWQIARETIAQKETATRREAETKVLRSEVTTLRTREVESKQLRSQIVALTSNRATCTALLRAVSRQLPPQVVLTRLHTNREGFALAGGVSGPGLTEKEWRAWIEPLQTGNGSWQLAGPPASLPATDFAVKGVWR